MFLKTQSQCKVRITRVVVDKIYVKLALSLCRSWIRPRRSPPLRATFSSLKLQQHAG